MKKIVLIIVLSLFAIKANSQDTNIVYNPLDTNCCNGWNGTLSYSKPCYSNDLQLQLINSSLWHTCKLRQIANIDLKYAQPYYMDSIVKVIGVRANLLGYNYYREGYYFKLMDMSFNTLDSVKYKSTVIGIGYDNYSNFYFTDTTSIQNFYITIDFDENDPIDAFNFQFTYNGFDANNYIIACNTGYEPWLIIDGVHMAFSEHDCYKYYKNTYLAFFPILYIERNSSLGNGLDLDKYTNIFPNPAKDNINITCSFIIEEIEILDIMGRKVKGEEVKDYSKTINTQNLSKGIYIAKIKTQQGTTTKKFTIE